MVRIASFNVENLFARPGALNQATWAEGQPILDAYRKVNALFQHETYTAADKMKILELLVELDICSHNDQGAIRRKHTQFPRWAWLRKNRGAFDREPNDATQSVEIIASGRADWIGWVELAKENIDEAATRMTARVIRDVEADIIGLVEVEDRPSLVRFNVDLLNGFYSHAMLVDGNDERGIDVGIMTKEGFEIESIRSNVDVQDAKGTIFSRDCPQYQVHTTSGATVHVLVNHFKSQSGGGGERRRRQAEEVRRIVNGLIAAGQHVIVLGDLNEGPVVEGSQAVNLAALFDNNSPLIDCYSLSQFQTGNKPGTFDSCGLRNRLDYIFISQSLQTRFTGGGVFRMGLWGSRATRPTAWETYPEMTNSSEQASDHSLIFLDLDI